MTPRNPGSPQRFYSLHVLRGVAALAVVLWHWSHFFFSGTKAGPVDSKQLPLVDWAFLFFSQVGLSVYLFFTLSGFLFYWLYSRPVAEGAITPEKFAWLRFSRLYPLHFVTFLMVAVGQIWMFSTQGGYFVYPYNDARHVVLNVFLASSWGLERGESFNWPIWAASVEALLYAMFFLCCRFLPVRGLVLAMLSIFGFVVLRKYHAPVGLGMGCFFLGGCVLLAYQRIVTSRHALKVAIWATCLTVVGLVAYLTAYTWLVRLAAAHPAGDVTWFSLRSIPFLWRLDPYLLWATPKVLRYWPTVVLFPLIILSLALIETYRGSLGKRISFLGDISYSVILLHFPLQLLIVGLAARLNIDRSIYYSPWFMAMFFTTLILLSLASYHYFEAPAQKLLRRIGVPSRSPDAVQRASERTR